MPHLYDLIDAAFVLVPVAAAMVALPFLARAALGHGTAAR